MKETKSEYFQEKTIKPANSAKVTHSLESKQTLQVATPHESESLSKSLCLSLMGLIRDVNKEGPTPDTVNASCNAANAIYKILRLNFEMKKDGF